MLDKDEVRNQLALIDSYEGFRDYCSTICQLGDEVIFDALFNIAIQNNGDGAAIMAGYVLIQLEPKCPLTCEEIIKIIGASSKWDVSDKSIPIYLISQFGKWNLFNCINDVIAKETFDARQLFRVQGIWYMARLPTMKLADEFFTHWQYLWLNDP